MGLADTNYHRQDGQTAGSCCISRGLHSIPCNKSLSGKENIIEEMSDGKKGILPPGNKESVLDPAVLDVMRFPEQEHHLGTVTGTCRKLCLSIFLYHLESVATVEITAKGKWEWQTEMQPGANSRESFHPKKRIKTFPWLLDCICI